MRVSLPITILTLATALVLARLVGQVQRSRRTWRGPGYGRGGTC